MALNQFLNGDKILYVTVKAVIENEEFIAFEIQDEESNTLYTSTGNGVAEHLNNLMNKLDTDYVDTILTHENIDYLNSLYSLNITLPTIIKERIIGEELPSPELPTLVKYKKPNLTRRVTNEISE